MVLKEMRAQVVKWLRESWDDPSLIDDAINDAIESLWTSIITVYIEDQMGGPVNLTIPANAYRTQLGTITDPVAAPTVNNFVAGVLAQHTVSICYSLVTDSGTETNVSPVTTSIIPVNDVASVPSPTFVDGTIGWNLYAFAGTSTDIAKFVRQNDIPIDFNQSTWQEPESGLITSTEGPLAPTSNTTADDLFYIEHLEVQMPDTTFKAYNQQSLDSEAMRRAARTISSTSPYQNYYFDVLSGQTLELRPAAGIQLNSQYFYVKKPRRLRFDNSQIPFIRGPYVPFIRYFAISLCKLVEEEYQAAQQWEGKAGAARMDIKQSYTKAKGKTVQTVTPYIIF